MRLALLALLALPAAAHAFPKSTLVRGVLRIQNGDFAEGVADLEGIRANADDADARPKDLAKLWAYLAEAHVRLAASGDGDPAYHLDVAFADWSRCVAIDDSSAKSMVRKCRSDASFASITAFNRAVKIATAIQEHAAGGSPAEARNRCTQVSAYSPESLLGEACRATVARATGDTDVARSAAIAAADRVDALEALPKSEVPRLDLALAMAIQAVLHAELDVDGANALLARADAAQPKLDGQTLANVEQLRPLVAEFAEKLVPARAAALSGEDSEAWSTWLATATSLKLFELGVADAAKAVVAMPDDTKVLELAGATFQNAAAARSSDPDRRAVIDLMRQAAAAFARCVEVDAEHPRCGDHLTAADETLAGLTASE